MQWKLEKTQAFTIRKSGHNTGLPKNFSLSADKDLLSSAQLFLPHTFLVAAGGRRTKQIICSVLDSVHLAFLHHMEWQWTLLFRSCFVLWEIWGGRHLLNSVKAKHPSVIWHLCVDSLSGRLGSAALCSSSSLSLSSSQPAKMHISPRHLM